MLRLRRDSAVAQPIINDTLGDCEVTKIKSGLTFNRVRARRRSSYVLRNHSANVVLIGRCITDSHLISFPLSCGDRPVQWLLWDVQANHDTQMGLRRLLPSELLDRAGTL